LQGFDALSVKNPAIRVQDSLTARGMMAFRIVGIRIRAVTMRSVAT
jgi:hypothetical protein